MPPVTVTRRAALQLGVAAAGALALTSTPAIAAAAATPAPQRRVIPQVLREDWIEDRFRFDCITSAGTFPPVTRLEQVWASPLYMTVTGCVVTYYGQEPFELTETESAVVDIVELWGGDVSDRTGTYRLVLAASTRVDPDRFDETLAELGQPVVAASLQLAPDAPQAHLLEEWLYR